MIAFFVGVVALIICAVVTSERKNLIPPKNEAVSDSNTKKPKKTETSITKQASAVESQQEFKNPTGLNILLYVGCFLIIASLTSYVSSVDEALVPPIVLSITLLALIASILIFKFVKFLKPSSYAFNISALVMFLFWIPSLEALGLEYDSAALASFFFSTVAGIISAAIFKHRALWYAPAISIIGLIITALNTLSIEFGLDSILALYGTVVVFMALGISLRYLWKSKASWLPVQIRHAVRTFSFVYPALAFFFTLVALDDIEKYPFVLTIFTALLSFYILLDSILFKKKSFMSILRICLSAVCITLAIDACFGLAHEESSLFHKNIILSVILANSIVQGLISCLFFAIKHDEKSHAHERPVFAASLVGFGLCSMISSIDYSFSSYVSHDLFSDIITITSELAIVIYSLFALILDRNPLMLIITAMGICDFAVVNFDTSSPIACIILSVGAVIFSISYSALRKLFEKHSLEASIISAIICALAALFLGSENHITYIPILAIGLSLAIQGFLLDKSALRIAGIYIAALGIVTAWGSVRSEFLVTTPGFFHVEHSYPSFVYIMDILMCLVPPAAAFLLSLFDKAQFKTLKDGTTIKNFTPNFVIGFVIAVFNTIFIISNFNNVSFFAFTISLFVLLALLIWSLVRKWTGFEIAALCAVLLLVFEFAGDNIWLASIIAGTILIGIVVYVSYKNFKKQNAKPVDAPANNPIETKSHVAQKADTTTKSPETPEAKVNKDEA